MITMTAMPWGEATAELTVRAEELRRTTVTIRAGRGARGSGVIWRSDGLIVTNAHVVPGTRATVELDDGRSYRAALTMRDTVRDLAALQLDSGNGPLTAIEKGDSGALRAGELVLAMGDPHGIAGALSIGVIHSANSENGRWIKADIRLAPGNSGGPLADARGRVIGINTLVSFGLAYAIPATAVARFLAARGQRAYLGVTVEPVMVEQGARRALAFLIINLDAGGAAERAGLMIGDLVTAINGRAFAGPRDLTVTISDCNPGDQLTVELLRAGRASRVTVTLGTTASGEEAA